MNYKFICPKCKNEVDIAMPMSEYTDKGHLCENCGEEMKRDPKSFCCSYKTNCDGFFGKSR